MLRRIPFALAVPLSVVILFAPGQDVPDAPAGTDKLVHLGLFALLAGTGLLAGLPRVPLLVGLVCYGAVSELVQALAGLARSGDPLDLAADTVGALAVPLLLAAFGRGRVPKRHPHPDLPDP